MKQSVYVLIVTITLAGCGKKDSSGDSTTAQAVNSETVQVTQVVGTGLVEPEEGIIKLAAASGGIVKEVIKRAGEQVRKNEPVIKLDDETDQIGIKQLLAQIRSQSEQTRLAALNLQDARIKLTRKSGLLRSTRDLLSKGAETTSNFDDLDTEVKSLILDTLKAAATLELEKGRLDGARENLRLARANAEKKILTSPYDGMLQRVLRCHNSVPMPNLLHRDLKL
jgi:multidrug resistance efflux pump